jgi:hypothetical protein
MFLIFSHTAHNELAVSHGENKLKGVKGVGTLEDIQHSMKIIQDIWDEDILKPLNLTVTHLRDFIGEAFLFAKKIETDVSETFKKLESLGESIIGKLVKELIDAIRRLIEDAEHRVLDGILHWIYPPPPVNISKDHQ